MPATFVYLDCYKERELLGLSSFCRETQKRASACLWILVFYTFKTTSHVFSAIAVGKGSAVRLGALSLWCMSRLVSKNSKKLQRSVAQSEGHWLSPTGQIFFSLRQRCGISGQGGPGMWPDFNRHVLERSLTVRLVPSRPLIFLNFMTGILCLALVTGPSEVTVMGGGPGTV